MLFCRALLFVFLALASSSCALIDGLSGNGNDDDGGSNNCPNGQVRQGNQCVDPNNQVRCGNGRIENQEECDQSNFQGSGSCRDKLGPEYSGNLSCTSDCRIDTTHCTHSFCGDGHIDHSMGEQCEPGMFEGATCSSQRGPGSTGTLACSADCRMIDTSHCGQCGNGTIEEGEDCEYNTLGGATCASVSPEFQGGTLACGNPFPGGQDSGTNVPACHFDTSHCVRKVPAPQGLMATALSAAEIELTWTPPAADPDLVAGIAVERRAEPDGIWLIAGSAELGVPHFRDRGLEPGRRYSYRIYAYARSPDGFIAGPSGPGPNNPDAGVADGGPPTPDARSVFSNMVSATTTMPATAPAAPTSLTATSTDGWTVVLAWTDRATDESGFRILRNAHGMGFVPYAEVGSNVTSFVDFDVAAERRYDYRVTAFNNSVESAFAEGGVTTPAAMPTHLPEGIMTDTVIDAAGGPYVVDRNLVVFPGVKLEARAGAIVRVQPMTMIEVRGRLELLGTPEHPIHINAQDPEGQTWMGIKLTSGMGATAKLTHAAISHAFIGVQSGEPGLEIFDSAFDHCGYGVNTYGAANTVLLRSAFTANDRAAQVQSGVLLYSTFTTNNLAIDANNIHVCYNSIVGNTTAVQGQSYDLRFNQIISNTIGATMQQSTGSLVASNTLTGNSTGIAAAAGNTVTQNNLYGNTVYNLQNTSNTNLNAAQNWWGTTDSAAIQSTIRDGADDTSLGLVQIQPVATSMQDTVPPSPL